MNAQLLIANMRFLRKLKKLTQEKQAKELNKEYKRYQAWELGYAQPDVDSMVEIAQYHRVSLDDLMTKDLTN